MTENVFEKAENSIRTYLERQSFLVSPLISNQFCIDCVHVKVASSKNVSVGSQEANALHESQKQNIAIYILASILIGGKFHTFT